jgi:acetyl esterase/lipase
VWLQRAWIGLVMRLMFRAPGVQVAPVSMNGVSGVAAASPGSDHSKVVLYLHGGGYCIGSPGAYRSTVTQLARRTRARVIAPSYRLAPEHPHPAGLEDALSAYSWLLTQDIAADRIAIAGDSAGGGLALATVLAIRDRGLPMPSSIVLISPCLDLTFTTPSIETNARLDPMLRPSWVRWCARQYLGGLSAEHPACSPLFADLKGLPPMLVQVGSDEILLDDATRIVKKSNAAGVDATLRVFERLWHDFQVHAGVLDEADTALDDIATFLLRQWEAEHRRAPEATTA